MARPFFEVLRDLRGGLTLEELAEEVALLVRAVRDTGKSGELMLKLKFKPGRGGSATYLTVEDTFSVKLPKLEKTDTIFYVAGDNSLTRQDPSQMDLPIVRPVIVDQETGEIKQLDGDSNG